MASKQLLICDGCGAEEEVHYYPNSPEPKTKGVRVSINEDNRNHNITAELCPSCIATLVKSADPKQWPRAASRS